MNFRNKAEIERQTYTDNLGRLRPKKKKPACNRGYNQRLEMH